MILSKQFGDFEVDKLLEGLVCSICGKEFVGREQKDNAICSGKNPFQVSHEDCWHNKLNELEATRLYEENYG
jgi:hypothetical protein